MNTTSVHRVPRLLPGIALAAALVAGCAPQGARSVSPDTLAAAAATISPADVYDRIAFLAADELLGRDTPSEGLDTAAAWIVEQLDAFGLEPAGEGGWLQRYPYPLEALDAARTRLEVSAGATHTFAYGVDFFAWGGAGTTGTVGALYLGSAIHPTDGGLRDRVAFVRLRHGPLAAASDFDRETRRRIRATIDRAAGAGAAGVVFVLDQDIPAERLALLAERAEEPRRSLGGSAAEAGIHAFFMTRPAAGRVFRMAGLEEGLLDLAGRPARPVPLPGVSLRLAAPRAVLEDDRPPNVVGVLRGSDPALRDTYVVLTAHMDHVGVGRPDATGDSIYNGADDDASGTAVLVEVAEAMARLEPRPRRSVLFLAVSGEEKGLLGSRWFTENPTVPLENVVANINLDMVGRNAPDSIVAIGQEYSSLGRLALEIAERHRADLRLTVAEDLWPEQRFFFRSDHFNFVRNGVPALFFFAGTHEDYHRPGDEVDEVDTDKTARVGRLVFHLTHAIADSEEPPRWNRQGQELVRSLTRD